MAKFKSDEIVVCALSFVMADPTVGDRTYKRWQRVTGSDPGVTAHPSWFVRENEATDEALRRIESDHWNASMSKAYDRPVDAKVSPPPPKPIAVEDQRVCIRQLLGAPGTAPRGRPINCLPGVIVSKNDLVFKTFPDSFIKVNPKNLDPRAALIATANMETHGREGEITRKVWAGEWLEASDPLVAIHPESFIAPALKRALAGYGPADD